MDEARIREIVREELKAARVILAPPPLTPEQEEAAKGRMARGLVDRIAEFAADGGKVVFK